MADVKNVKGFAFPSQKGVRCVKVEQKNGVLDNGQAWENCTAFFSDLEGRVMQFKLKYGKGQPVQYDMLKRMVKGGTYVLGFEIDVNDVQQIILDLVDFVEI